MKLPACSCLYDPNATPVCGVNGKDYPNRCLANCENVRVKHEGKCSSSAGCNGCPKIRDPVCGKDNKTYPNMCEMLCRNVTLRYKGTCRVIEPPLPCICPAIY